MRSKNLFKIVLLLSIFAATSCNNRMQERIVVEETAFNQAIIDDLPAYKKLHDLIAEHMDTIVRFRLAQLDDPNKITDLGFLHENGNDFIQQETNFKNMPAFILPKLDSAFYAIKKGHITGFSINNRGMIKMSVEHTYDKKSNCDTYSSLVWNKPHDFPLPPTAKDTLLNTECTYVIDVLKRGNPAQ